MSTAIEKLEEIIESQEEKISDLEKQLEVFENSKDWQVARIINEKKMAESCPGYDKLPFPRFEMRIIPRDDNWYTVEWLYGLCYKHLDDCVILIPFGRATGSGPKISQMKDGRLDTPMGSGLHMRTEMNLLNINGYVICNGRIKTLEEVQEGFYSQETLDKALKEMKR